MALDPMLADLLSREIDAINRIFYDLNIAAGTRADDCIIAGQQLIIYQLALGGSERVAAVLGAQAELSERISRVRSTWAARWLAAGDGSPARRAHLENIRAGSVVVRPRKLPLALELPHPFPAPLGWASSRLGDGPAAGCATRLDGGNLPLVLLGRVFNRGGASDLFLDLDRNPHALIAATTGGGKSSLLRLMIADMAHTMPPDRLNLILIDPKNDALGAFRRLPHVAAFEFDPAAGARLLHHLAAEIRRRIDHGWAGLPRLVCVIDELRELIISESGLERSLASVLSLGRSLGVHVLAATQYPAARDLSGVAKANFPARIVGHVTDATAANIAAGLPGSGAQYLPAACGAFVAVADGRIERFQAYYLGNDAGFLATRIRSHYRPAADGALTIRHLPALASDPLALPALPAPAPSESDRIAAAIAPLLPDYQAGKVSKSALIRAAFGPTANTGGANLRRVDAALSQLAGVAGD